MKRGWVSNSPCLTFQTCYEATSLSEASVAKNSAFIMWDSQPNIFKSYPKHLFSYGFDDHEAFKTIKQARRVTSKLQVGGKPYYRLNVPSAGNLHPLELYVQIRALKGVLSGIYHVDAKEEKLVLIQEIEVDGLELHVGMEKRYSGMIFVLSTVYFRSFWKYGLRSWRYLYLDAGHQIAALQAAAALNDQMLQSLSDFDLKGLNHMMGFDHQEHCVAAFAIGEDKQRSAKPLKKALMQVQPTDYIDKDMTLQTWLDEAKVFKDDQANIYETYEKKSLEQSLHRRRSAREFYSKAISVKDRQGLFKLFETLPYPLELSYAFFNVEAEERALFHFGQKQAVYKGDFIHTVIVSALVDQNVVVSSGMVIFITSENFNEQVLMKAGKFGHQVYIESTQRDLGCSGIGAFYDESIKALLGKKYMLYALVVGERV